MKILLCENEILPKVAEYCDTIVSAAKQALLRDSIDGQLNILFTDADEIRRMNREYRSVDSVTDVLSFPTNELAMPLCECINDVDFETDSESGEIVLGDIAICLDRAIEQAEEYGHSLKRELCFLAMHGTLHLLGYDHMCEEDEKKMFGLQEKLLLLLEIER